MDTHLRTATSRRRPQPPAPVPDWSKLSRGDAVRVFRPDGSSMLGQVDMLALDRSVFWIIQDDGGGRVMVCSADKPRVLAVPHKEIQGRKTPVDISIVQCT